MEVAYYRFDVFSQEPNKGNPAGVVYCDEGVSTEKMQQVAKVIGFSETIFILPSEIATFRLRFFSPGSEMPLCGHGTIAAVTLWCQSQSDKVLEELTVETIAGCLTIGVQIQSGTVQVTMKQAAPQFQPFEGDVNALVNNLGISVNDLDERYPIMYGSTGSWTLIVPVKGLAVMKKMQPNNQQFPEVLQNFPQASVHPICFESYHDDSLMHGRHFSGAGTGTIEDPVTGTASGVMGAYYYQFVTHNKSLPLKMNVEQGQEMGKDGQLSVLLERLADTLTISIQGQALLVSKELLKL
ncbi:PhzF family phenazine biosynthesis isomerase [Vagococcus xieshaowenii]|uniref:PhzF family phenazine biosynthesis isomerase n=2 Tax=Vagococcus xieshaowenii TaxID=2562451 RepID=A0AAJ5JLY9_9ENTE|nr:PhzF family phenazine biosynthesis isomerase [Vagococcus xieshaowenii]TFZ39463.1 PhzF family phenazine biosynthesis isomerase [Vagococcus xieshaowenii]